MDSDTFNLTCPICGRSDIGSYPNHLQTHSKQALIETLINQSHIINPAEGGSVKRGLHPEFVSVDPQRSRPEDADPSGVSSSRRNNGISMRHGYHSSARPRSSHSRRISCNPLETEGFEATASSSAAAVSLTEDGHSIISPSSESPVRSQANTSGSSEEHVIVSRAFPDCSFTLLMPEHQMTGYTGNSEELESEQQEAEHSSIQFDEQQVLEFVSEECGDKLDGALYVDVSDGGHDTREMETATTLALKMTQLPLSKRSNFIKYIVDESGGGGSEEERNAEPGVKWIFPDGVAVPVYSSFPHQIPSSSGMMMTGKYTAAAAADEDSSLSNSKGNTNSSGSGRGRHLNSSDVDLMTDEEIPPRGEISEFEESNTSSMLSEDSKHGLLNRSLGSMFSDRVRRMSPIIVDSESLSSHSKSKKVGILGKKKLFGVTSSFTIPEGHKCHDCVHEQYFSTIFELAQHHGEVHSKPFNSGLSRKKDTKAELANQALGLDWGEPYHKPLISSGVRETEPLILKQEIRRDYKQKEFSCLFCVFSTLDKKALAKHLSLEHTGKHLDPSQFECTTCGKMFGARSNLVKHLLIHRGKRHKCGTCSKAFTSQFKLKEHYRVHTKDYPFGCLQCERTFRTPSLRTAHVKRVHEGIKVSKSKLEFYCGICHRVLHSKAALHSHTKTHFETASKCHFCQESFPKSSILVRHIRTTHDSTYVSKDSKECSVCRKMLHPNSMKSHMRIHKGEKPFPCPVCSMTFRTYANLSSHSWSHTNLDKPFKCKKCPKSYLFKKYLDSHMIVHKRRTSHFTCNECGVKFTSKMNMKRHIEEHFKEKKFKCKACGKCFHRKYYLSEHERIHSNVKPFSCSICGKTSTTKSNHRSHIKIHDARESGTLEG